MRPDRVNTGIIEELEDGSKPPMSKGWTRRFTHNGKTVAIERVGWTKGSRSYIVRTEPSFAYLREESWRWAAAEARSLLGLSQKVRSAP